MLTWMPKDRWDDVLNGMCCQTTIAAHLSSLTPSHLGLKLPDDLDQQLANLTNEMKSMQMKEKDKDEKEKALSKVIHYQVNERMTNEMKMR